MKLTCYSLNLSVKIPIEIIYKNNYLFKCGLSFVGTNFIFK